MKEETCACAPARNFSGKQLLGFGLGIASLVILFLAPESANLSHEALTSIGVLLCCVFMWFFGSMSTGVVGVLGCFLLFILGVQPTFQSAFSGFTTTTAWFILAVYCMTAYMQYSTLGLRLTKRFILWAGADSRKLVLAIMVVTALCSAFMTDTGAVALSLSFSVPLLKLVGAKKDNSNLGKCLMIGICIAACIGGFTTPCGHSLNVLSLGLLQTQLGISVGFLTWMAYGVPCAIVVLPVAWACLVKVFPPENVRQEQIDAILKDQFGTGGFTKVDAKCLVMMILLPVLWIAGNWVPFLNATVVSIFGMLMLFVPGMGILKWKEFEGLVSWNLFLFFGGVLSIGAAITATGAADFMASAFLNSGITNLPVLAALLLIGAVLYLLHTVCPTAPAWCAILLPPLFTYATTVVISPFVPAFMIVSLMAGSYLVPLCPAMSMTYDHGYYKFGEMARSGVISSIVLVAVVVLWSFLLGGVLVI